MERGSGEGPGYVDCGQQGKRCRLLEEKGLVIIVTSGTSTVHMNRLIDCVVKLSDEQLCSQVILKMGKRELR